MDVGGTVTISQEIADLTEDRGQELEAEESVQIGSIQGSVVGLRYYTGTVGIFMYVCLMCIYIYIHACEYVRIHKVSKCIVT